MAEPADEQKIATEALYKQNVDLAVRNKTLSLLRSLYQISILALEPEPLAEKIVATVRESFDFELVGILHFDTEADALVPLKFALSDRLTQSEQAAGIKLENIAISPLRSRPILAEAVAKATPAPRVQIPDIWDGAVSAEALKILTEAGHIKNISAHPLVINQQTTGVLLLALNRSYDSLSQFEHDSIASLVDVTAVALDRARLYQALKVANEKLTLANQGQTQLIHILNHQIKGYLARGRTAFAELLEEQEYQPLSEAMKKMLEEGLRSLTEGVDFVQGVLNASSVEQGTMTYNMTPTDFRQIVSEAAEKQKAIAEQKGLKYEVAVPSEPMPALGDALQLKEAIRNLIDNSIHYTATGSIKISLERNNGIGYRLAIADTGVGLSDEDKPKLFTQGGRGKDSLKINANSTGYGLSFVKGVIEAHHGRVWAESAGPGKGSTFFVELPAAH